ncbi:DUF1054 domain-containing protein [Macrococcus equipercicus]|uniref:UPF0637 protein ERX35_001990 n=1 Tax=Macrococcus equipercicus TaxID=69967 RepID=A0ABQ6RBV8_9STAP|nr:DUF1054 domain-containing protein [Macrococcus equipercicus]KAA1042675.1 DUF1054 domain-containing protein [Macrococcus equipercicus]
MANYHFTTKDFEVFNIDGLEPRMAALIDHIRPKLNNLGTHMSAFLTEHTGDVYYPHVAKHLRRKTNPPNDTWVAFATHKRGYKMLPHFQIGLFGSHAFVLYGVIYESPEKANVAELWQQKQQTLRALPEDFIMKKDHMKEDYTLMRDVTDEELTAAVRRLKEVKKGELLFGKVYPPEHPALKSDQAFINELEETFLKLIDLQ